MVDNYTHVFIADLNNTEPNLCRCLDENGKLSLVMTK